MSLEFAVEYPCRLRARYDEKHLREWGRLGKLHSIVTTGDQHAPGPDKLQWIENAAAEIDLLQTETSICPECPACLPVEIAGDGEAVGCLGPITYQFYAKLKNFLAYKFHFFFNIPEQQDHPRFFQFPPDLNPLFDGKATKELRRVPPAVVLLFFNFPLP